jgi:hypothetical protein
VQFARWHTLVLSHDVGIGFWILVTDKRNTGETAAEKPAIHLMQNSAPVSGRYAFIPVMLCIQIPHSFFQAESHIDYCLV